MSRDDLVQTPYGLVPRSEVVPISRDETVKVVEGRLKKCDLHTDRVLEDLGPVADEALSADPYAYAARLREDSAPAGRKFVDGQRSGGHAAQDESLTYIQSFRTTWTVPSKPRNPLSPNVFFLWNGLHRGALQPVLDWSNNTEGKASYGIANWAYIGNKYVHGDHLYVDPGTSLTGVIRFRSLISAGYMYTLGFVGFPDADFTVVRSLTQGPANGVILCFEPYFDTSDESSLPPDTKVDFVQINLSMQSGHPTPPTINWDTSGGMKVVDNSSSHGEVDCYLHSQ
ncbi:hypothetical protein [Streptomyces sp. NPDC048196]|uniref:hypothetical protein n=1 Tax=Streptomyces sp. NPDC048196 TaxID=3154712 RepID=UPI0033D1A221